MNEEEVIERLNRFKTIKVLYGNTFTIHLEQLEQLQNDIETVLNLLEKKDKQINSKNGTINALHAALKERTEERDRKDDIITKQSKIINLIYDFLYKFGSKFSGSFMKALSEDGFDIKKCENCKYETCDCKECIKQYFERKVENGN